MTRPHPLRFRSGLHVSGLPFTILLATLLALSASPFAHPSGTSRAIIRLLDNDSLTLEIDANALDVMEATSTSASTVPFDAEHTRRYQQRAAHYLLSRTVLHAGGGEGGRRSVLDPRVVSWKRDGRGPDDDLAGDSVAARDTVVILTYGGTLPEGATTLTFSTALFPEFGVQALCETSVYWNDTLIERRWLTLDKTLRIPLARDSLDARLAAARTEPARATGDGLFARFVGLGFTHILPHGLDHILFVLALFFFSTRLRPLLLQVTAFTVAHSCTLALTLLGIVSLPANIVEPLIALSIAVVGLENVFFRNVKTSRWLVVFAFGLIHGMGFAGVLGELGLPEGGFWPALIGFNAGVELGQLAVIALAFALTAWFRDRSWYFKGVVVPASLAISAVGLYWAVTRVVGG